MPIYVHLCELLSFIDKNENDINSYFEFLKCGRKENNYRFISRLRPMITCWMKLTNTYGGREILKF